MGIFKLGSLIKYIPRPVTIGFTSGIAINIFTGQITNFLGLTGIKKHESFIANMNEIYIHINTLNFYSVITALICLIIILIMPKIFPKIPSSLVGIIISTLIATMFFKDYVPTIGTVYGMIPNTLPKFTFPNISLEHI